MKKIDRRFFLKTTLASGALAGASSLFAKSPLSGLNIVQYARGNTAGNQLLIDACCSLSLSDKDMKDFMEASASHGVMGNLFVPQAKLFGDDFSSFRAAELNVKIYQLSERFKDAKFAGAISLRNSSDAKMEIERCVNQYKFSALTFPDFDKTGGLVWDEANMPLFQTAANLGVPVIVSYGGDNSESNLENQICRLIEKINANKSLKNLKIVLPRYGGTFAWLLSKKGEKLEKDHPFYFYADTEIFEDALKCFKNVFGSDRLVFGSCGKKDYEKLIKNLEKLDVNSSDFKKAYFENSSKLFGFNLKQ